MNKKNRALIVGFTVSILIFSVITVLNLYHNEWLVDNIFNNSNVQEYLFRLLFHVDTNHLFTNGLIFILTFTSIVYYFRYSHAIIILILSLCITLIFLYIVSVLGMQQGVGMSVTKNFLLAVFSTTVIRNIFWKNQKDTVLTYFLGVFISCLLFVFIFQNTVVFISYIESGSFTGNQLIPENYGFTSIIGHLFGVINGIIYGLILTQLNPERGVQD